MASRIKKSGFRKRTQFLVRGSGAAAAFLGGTIFAPAALAQTDSASSAPLELGPLQVEGRGTGNALGHDTGLATLPGSVQDTPQAIAASASPRT
jgi:hypothetical protein